MDLSEIFKEEDVEEVADKILSKLLSKIKDDLSDSFYNEMKSYLFEHYSNASDDIKADLIKQLGDEFANNPKDYKFTNIRKRIFEENKGVIIKSLQYDIILKHIESILFEHTNELYIFDWQWDRAIIKYVRKNYRKINIEEKINEEYELERTIKDLEIKNLKNKIEQLEAEKQQHYGR